MTRCTRNIGKFGRIVAASALAVGLLPALVHAQKAEVSVFGGYTTSEGIHASQDRIITGLTYNQLDITSGGSWGLTAGYYITPAFELEFLYNDQFSSLQAKGPAGTLKLADASVNNYHGLFVYNWGEDSHIRPFFFGGLGATHYASGRPGAPGFQWKKHRRRDEVLVHLGWRRQGLRRRGWPESHGTLHADLHQDQRRGCLVRPLLLHVLGGRQSRLLEPVRHLGGRHVPLRLTLSPRPSAWSASAGSRGTAPALAGPGRPLHLPNTPTRKRRPRESAARRRRVSLAESVPCVRHGERPVGLR